MKCFNCNNEAEHNHHVVPKSKGGISTVPLCAECHQKVHNLKSMETAYLTKLGLIKAEKEYLCFIFYNLLVEEKNIKEITLLLNSEGYNVTENHVKNKIKRMEKINSIDLLNTFEPILELKKGGYKIYNQEYFIKLWENYYSKHECK